VSFIEAWYCLCGWYIVLVQNWPNLRQIWGSWGKVEKWMPEVVKAAKASPLPSSPSATSHSSSPSATSFPPSLSPSSSTIYFVNCILELEHKRKHVLSYIKIFDCMIDYVLSINYLFPTILSLNYNNFSNFHSLFFDLHRLP